jgi:hypothetical protein
MVSLALPEVGDWELFIDGKNAGTQVLLTEKKTAAVAAVSCNVYVKKN